MINNQGFHAKNMGTSLCLQSINAGCFVVFESATDLMACLNLEDLKLSNVEQH